MATKISPYRTGSPRFGSKGGKTPDWDPRVKTTQLNPEQLERLRAGEPLDQILAQGGEKEMGEPKVTSYKKYQQLEEENARLKEENENLKLDLQKPSAVPDKSEAIEFLKNMAAEWENTASKKSAELDNAQEENASLKDQLREAEQAKEKALNDRNVMESQFQLMKSMVAEQSDGYQSLIKKNKSLEKEAMLLKTYLYNKLKQELEPEMEDLDDEIS